MLRRAGRLLLAAPYLAAGINALRHPGPQAEAARPVAAQLSARLTGPARAVVPSDPEPLLRAAGAVGAAAAALLALGRVPRTSAAVLLVSTAPVVWTRHPYWRETDPVRRRDQRTQLVQAVGLLGGALLTALDRPGPKPAGSAADPGATAAAAGRSRSAPAAARSRRARRSGS